MVVFTCNNCGDSLQKPKVAKHYQFQCRKAVSLTCVDCFKDFMGDEYNAHTKCITEAERYGGKDFVPKASMNKGEKKQQEWINLVNNVVASTPNLSKDEKKLLEYVSKHENIPRKKAKFLNFVKSSMGNRVPFNVIESCWTKLESALKELSQKPNPTPAVKNGVDQGNDVQKSEDKNDKPCEKSENDLKPKKRKNKSEISEENEEPVVKLRATENIECSEAKMKFDWHSSVLEIMGSKGTISAKKLEKKIVKKYLETQSSDLPHEKIISRLHKKLKKMPEINIVDSTINLV